MYGIVNLHLYFKDYPTVGKYAIHWASGNVILNSVQQTKTPIVTTSFRSLDCSTQSGSSQKAGGHHITKPNNALWSEKPLNIRHTIPLFLSPPPNTYGSLISWFLKQLKAISAEMCHKTPNNLNDSEFRVTRSGWPGAGLVNPHRGFEGRELHTAFLVGKESVECLPLIYLWLSISPKQITMHIFGSKYMMHDIREFPKENPSQCIILCIYTVD